jgi:hypothetical protein
MLSELACLNDAVHARLMLRKEFIIAFIFPMLHHFGVLAHMSKYTYYENTF